MSNTPVQTFVSQWGMGKETTWSTGVTPTFGLPLNNPKWVDTYAWVPDNGFRGLPAKDFALYQGVGHGELDFESLFYPDDSGNLVTAILGKDSITGAGPTYTHAIGAATALPPSYTGWDFSGLIANARKYQGAYCSQLDIKWVADGAMSLTPKFMSIRSVSAAKPSETYSAASIFIPWQGALTLNGSANAKLMDLSLSLKRATELVPGSSGTQDVTAIVPGRLEVTGTATFMASDETEFLLYTGNTQGAFSLLLTSGTNTCTIQMTKCAFESPAAIERSKEYVMFVGAFRGLSNATDNVTGGATQSPIKFSLVNGVSAAY